MAHKNLEKSKKIYKQINIKINNQYGIKSHKVLYIISNCYGIIGIKKN